MAKMEQLHFWRDEKAEGQDASQTHAQRVDAISEPNDRDEFEGLVCSVLGCSDEHAEPESANGPPIAAPLESAVQAGVFGMTLDGPIALEQEGIEALTAEHANEMIILLSDCQAIEHAQRFGYDPATRRIPTAPERRESLLARLEQEYKRLSTAYADAVAAYAEGFGNPAAATLDQWVRKTVADGDPRKEPYSPSHPWHYYHAGDNAPPIPLELIEPNPDAGRWLAERLPKNPKRRIEVLREMLKKERTSLAADQDRYKQIVDRGAEALSRFDREIAHTSDAMAVATALALKYTHVSQGLGRVAWLTAQVGDVLIDERVMPEPTKTSSPAPGLIEP